MRILNLHPSIILVFYTHQVCQFTSSCIVLRTIIMGKCPPPGNQHKIPFFIADRKITVGFTSISHTDIQSIRLTHLIPARSAGKKSPRLCLQGGITRIIVMGAELRRSCPMEKCVWKSPLVLVFYYIGAGQTSFPSREIIGVIYMIPQGHNGLFWYAAAHRGKVSKVLVLRSPSQSINHCWIPHGSANYANSCETRWLPQVKDVSLVITSKRFSNERNATTQWKWNYSLILLHFTSRILCAFRDTVFPSLIKQCTQTKLVGGHWCCHMKVIGTWELQSVTYHSQKLIKFRDSHTTPTVPAKV